MDGAQLHTGACPNEEMHVSVRAFELVGSFVCVCVCVWWWWGGGRERGKDRDKRVSERE